MGLFGGYGAHTVFQRFYIRTTGQHHVLKLAPDKAPGFVCTQPWRGRGASKLHHHAFTTTSTPCAKAVDLRRARIHRAFVDLAITVPVPQCQIGKPGPGCAVYGYGVVLGLVLIPEPYDRAVGNPNAQGPFWRWGVIHISRKVGQGVPPLQNGGQQPRIMRGIQFHRCGIKVELDIVGGRIVAQQAGPHPLGNMGVVVTGNKVPAYIRKLAHALHGLAQCMLGGGFVFIHVACDQHMRGTLCAGQQTYAFDHIQPLRLKRAQCIIIYKAEGPADLPVGGMNNFHTHCCACTTNRSTRRNMA